MQRASREPQRSVALVCALCAALLSCGVTPEQARERALAYFAGEVLRAETSWSYLLPYLKRRYGVSVPLASGASLAPHTPDPPTLPVFRRLFLPRARASRADVSAVESPVDRVLATALHCDQLGLPGDWLQVLEDMTQRGDYALTHAVIALQWSVENGCIEWLAAAPLRARQIDGLVRLIDARAELARRDTRAADIWIEALAVMRYAGGAGRVRDAWLDAMLSLQRPDGGWPEHPDQRFSSPHTSIFALWVLLDTLSPDPADVPMIPPRRG